MADFVGYYRVSTQRQGSSGLGLEAQRTAVAAYVQAVGGRLIAEIDEVESGAKADRPKLEAAMKLAKSKKAMLVIAKLDRLARDVGFVSDLMRSGVEFVAADMPHANKLTVHIIAAIAEYEREVIGKRTKEALARAKARGVILGNPKVRSVSGRGSAQAKDNADAFAKRIAPHINAIRSQGITSLSRIAAALDACSVRTQRGKLWTAAGVKNVVARIERIGA